MVRFGAVAMMIAGGMAFGPARAAPFDFTVTPTQAYSISQSGYTLLTSPLPGAFALAVDVTPDGTVSPVTSYSGGTGQYVFTETDSEGRWAMTSGGTLLDATLNTFDTTGPSAVVSSSGVAEADAYYTDYPESPAYDFGDTYDYFNYQQESVSKDSAAGTTNVFLYDLSFQVEGQTLGGPGAVLPVSYQTLIDTYASSASSGGYGYVDISGEDVITNTATGQVLSETGELVEASLVAVPEPGSLNVLAVGVLGLCGAMRRRSGIFA